MSNFTRINEAIEIYCKEHKGLGAIQFLRHAIVFYDDRLEAENARKNFMSLLCEYANVVIERGV